jgi:hypothetical protein
MLSQRMMCSKKHDRDEKDDVTLFGGTEWMGDDGKVHILSCIRCLHDIFDIPPRICELLFPNHAISSPLRHDLCISSTRPLSLRRLHAVR